MRKWELAITAAVLSACICTGCTLPFAKKAEDKKVNEGTTASEAVIASGKGDGINGADAQQAEPTENTEEIIESAPLAETIYGEDDTELGGIPIISGEYSIEDCIDLPELTSVKGEYEKTPAPTYEDARIQEKFKLDAHPVYNVDELAEYGDRVVIDLYVEGSSDDSVEGSIMDMDVAVGAGEVDKAIEDAIVGMSVGMERLVTVKTEDGSVKYRVVLQSIARSDEPIDTDVVATLAELTEEVEELNNYKRFAALKQEVMNGSTIKKFPEKIVRMARSRFENKFLRGTTLTDYLNQEGITRAEFKAEEDEYALAEAKEMLVLEALSKRSGITKESEEYKNALGDDGENPEDPDALFYQVILERLFGKEAQN